MHTLAGLSIGFASAGIVIALAPEDFGSLDPIQMLSLTGIAIGSAGLAALGKELGDLLGLGEPELRDLANTLAGGVVAAIAVAFTFAFFETGQYSANRPHLVMTLAASTALPLIFHLGALAIRSTVAVEP